MLKSKNGKREKIVTTFHYPDKTVSCVCHVPMEKHLRLDLSLFIALLGKEYLKIKIHISKVYLCLYMIKP